MKHPSAHPLHLLTPREAEVVRHFASGKNYKEVAKLLSISPTTVRNHLQRAYRKLGVDDKAALAMLVAKA